MLRVASFVSLAFLGTCLSPESLVGSKYVVPFWDSYLESYKVIPKTNYLGPLGFRVAVFGLLPALWKFLVGMSRLVVIPALLMKPYPNGPKDPIIGYFGYV